MNDVTVHSCLLRFQLVVLRELASTRYRSHDVKVLEISEFEDDEFEEELDEEFGEDFDG